MMRGNRTTCLDNHRRRRQEDRRQNEFCRLFYGEKEIFGRLLRLHLFHTKNPRLASTNQYLLSMLYLNATHTPRHLITFYCFKPFNSAVCSECSGNAHSVHFSQIQILNLIIINVFNSFNFRCTNSSAHWRARIFLVIFFVWKNADFQCSFLISMFFFA